MPLTRREAISRLSALLALPLVRWPHRLDDPLHGTIAEYQAGRVRGDWTAADVTARALSRCATIATAFNAIDQLSHTALRDARASDLRLRRGTLRGPVDGVPMFAKSIYDMRDMPTTASSKPWASLFPAALRQDAIEVQRMRAAGVVILGKTAADDFAYHGNGTSSLTGQVRNPYDTTRLKSPGGSSAGSAVAVATGTAFAALGTDDGGSNRIPAQFCGVVGMKPTFGLVPRTGVIPTWPYLDTHGPLARTVEDAAALLAVIAGPDASDGLALREPWHGLDSARWRDDALHTVRVGVVETHVPRAQMSAPSFAAFDRALADLRLAGAVLEPFTPPVTRHDYRAQFAAFATERGDVAPNANDAPATANALRRYVARHGGSTERDLQRGLAPYRAFYDVLPEEWSMMQRISTEPYETSAAGQSFARSRASAVARLGAAFAAAGIEVMVYPTMPFPAPLATAKWPDIPTTLGYGNWLGLPEVSVPGGLGADGLPAGNLSFVGLPGSDARVLALAYAYERQSRRFVIAPT